MYASVIKKALIAASANVIAHSQSLAAAGFLTLTANPVVLDTQREVILTSAGDDSGLVWTIIGTDDTGNVIKDIFNGANGVATSNLNFKTIISIYGSAATASTVTAGTNTVGATPWKIFGDTIEMPNMSFTCGVTGTINYSVQYTQEPFLTPISPNGSNPTAALGPATPNPGAFDFSGLSGVTAAEQAQFTFAFHAWRLQINSGTVEVTCSGRQSGLASP